MLHQTLNFIYLLLAVPSLLVVAQTNLPPATSGVFTAQASSQIDAPIEDVWNALLDFPSYPDWNPFARSMVLIDNAGNPLADQTPQEGRRIRITAQIPPLDPPVDASTPSNPLHNQISIENITTIDHVNYRAAWKQIMLPDLLIVAERWSALSVIQTPDGPRTLYESREVFQNLVAVVVGLLFKEGLQEGFEAQALAMKNKLEGTA